MDPTDPSLDRASGGIAQTLLELLAATPTDREITLREADLVAISMLGPDDLRTHLDAAVRQQSNQRWRLSHCDDALVGLPEPGIHRFILHQAEQSVTDLAEVPSYLRIISVDVRHARYRFRGVMPSSHAQIGLDREIMAGYLAEKHWERTALALYAALYNPLRARLRQMQSTMDPRLWGMIRRCLDIANDLSGNPARALPYLMEAACHLGMLNEDVAIILQD